MADLSDLLARVEKATGRDDKLDADLAVQLRGWCLHEKTEYSGAQSDTGFTCVACGADSWGNKSRNGLNQTLYCMPPPAYTASLDAALALVEEKIPKANWRITRTGGDWRPGFAHTAFVKGPHSGAGDHEDGSPSAKGDGTTPPLAVLSALLRALIATEERAMLSASPSLPSVAT